MNTHSPIVRAEELDPFSTLAGAGHAFRGRFLDKCAIVEHWATRTLVSAGEKKRSTYLFGQKIEAVRGLASTEPARFKMPKRVLDLLDALKPFAELRTLLAHAVQTIALTGAGTGIVIFTPLSGTAPASLKLVLDQEEMAGLMKDLSRIAKELADQRLRAVSPSSPPPPKPAEAAGP
jgi:hypothetical protein